MYVQKLAVKKRKRNSSKIFFIMPINERILNKLQKLGTFKYNGLTSLIINARHFLPSKIFLNAFSV